MPDKQGRPTKAETKRTLARLWKSYNGVIDKVYTYGPNRETPLAECLQRAGPDNGAKLDGLRAAMLDAESYAIGRGWAYRATFGGLLWSR